MPQNMSLPSESSAYIFAPPQGALFEIADAVDAFALFLDLAQYRQQQRRQNGDEHQNSMTVKAATAAWFLRNPVANLLMAYCYSSLLNLII